MTAVIDIGSNSVRLLLDGIKYNTVTQLSQGLFFDDMLKDEPMTRTFNAVKEYHKQAKAYGAKTIFVFATAALRRAKNADIFIARLARENIEVDIISEDTESKIAFLGAYTGGNQAVLDIGGASSELVVGDENGIIYNHSLPYGCVTITEQIQRISEPCLYIKNLVQAYGKVPSFDSLIGIGGTLQSLATILLAVDYDNTQTLHGFDFYYDDIKTTVMRILDTPAHLLASIKGMHPKKTTVLPYGGMLAMGIMQYLNVRCVRLSNKDNLDGYFTLKYMSQS